MRSALLAAAALSLASCTTVAFQTSRTLTGPHSHTVESTALPHVAPHMSAVLPPPMMQVQDWPSHSHVGDCEHPRMATSSADATTTTMVLMGSSAGGIPSDVS